MIADNADDVAMFRALGFHPLQGWAMTAEFLDACPRDVLDRIAIAVGMVGSSLHKDDPLRAAILKMSGAKTFRPPWLELLTAAELQAKLRSMPKPSPAVAAGAARVAKVKRGVKR